MNYAPKIADAIRAIDVHTQTLKKPYMVSCEERQKNSVIRALNDIADNEVTVLAVPNSGINTLSVLTTGVQSYLGDMWANVKNMFNQVYSALGVANEFTSKKERLVVSESQGEQTPILALVKAILMILQSRVLPSPDNAPTVVSSTHIKASLKPMMIRYSTDVAIALGS